MQLLIIDAIPLDVVENLTEVLLPEFVIGTRFTVILMDDVVGLRKTIEECTIVIIEKPTE